MPVARKSRSSDPHDIERRLELIIHQHLADMEQNPEMFSAKDRLAAVQYIGMWINRKYGWGDAETEGAGSAVRKYSGAFLTKPNVVTKPVRQVRASDHSDEEDAA